MKKIISIIVAIMMVAALAVVTGASAFNPAGGCKTEFKVYKADPSAVVKDGIIGDGEYREIEVSHDVDTTDLMFGYQNATEYLKCEEFLPNVHFYSSWDEIHGINFAIKATLLETPWNETPQPGLDYYGDKGFPGDEFLFQFGAMFRVCETNSNGDACIINRGISKNTATGELLFGWYDENGYSDNMQLTAYNDYNVVIDGNTITYEISYPIAEAVKAADIVGGAPAEGAFIWVAMTATGGSEGRNNNDSKVYAISLGDTGYLARWNEFSEPSNAKAIFTNDPVIEVSGGDDGTTDPSTSGTTGSGGEVVDTTNNTDPKKDDPDVSGGEGTDKTGDDQNTPSTDSGNKNPSGGTDKAPSTSDPIVLAAVASVISACGFMISKKRK